MFLPSADVSTHPDSVQLTYGCLNSLDDKPLAERLPGTILDLARTGTGNAVPADRTAALFEMFAEPASTSRSLNASATYRIFMEFMRSSQNFSRNLVRFPAAPKVGESRRENRIFIEYVELFGETITRANLTHLDVDVQMELSVHSR